MTTAKWISSALALALVTVSVAAGGASAQPKEGGHGMHHGERHDARRMGHGPHGEHGFAGLDVDGDGVVSEEEFTDPSAARFAAIDTDGNGEVTVEEAAAYAEQRRAMRRQARAERMIERLDRDGNGSVNLEEMRNTMDRGAIFGRLDADGDGALSEGEMQAGREAMRRMRHGGGEPEETGAGDE
ncbi:calcium-binding protein [Roseivivax halodurans JCM 10272]|uniref:Calcium-binding protein n=1 Tax=Roseivivax halodurans JCM 10272 TaxID=1449350 RepID=X7EFW1_9RHOB|nr:EF-hand domain-containing protein [Roseivivax halodurans]ETX14770.1 calcium-binding protein [Roseivivax halodurans JCM 10272]